MVELIKNNINSSSRNQSPFQKSNDDDERGVHFPATTESVRSPTKAPPNGRRTILQGSLKGSQCLSTPTSLDSKTKYCPYLGGGTNRTKIIDYPARSNVCFGKESYEKKLLRKLIRPYSLIPAQRQREFCLAAFRRCPTFQAKENEKSEKTDK